MRKLSLESGLETQILQRVVEHTKSGNYVKLSNNDFEFLNFLKRPQESKIQN